MSNEALKENQEYQPARELMETMVATSQVPGGGNTKFVDALTDYLKDSSFSLKTVGDPEYDDRSLLVVEVGDPEGEQVLASISHSDVVGVEGQEWQHNPWELHEENGNWYGRGTCDTHGGGVSMLLAASRPEVRKMLEEEGKRISIIFTYDEEATSPELSMRGARLAAGKLGTESVVTGKYFISGEPTEIDGEPVPMRGHKGRWLANFIVDVEHAGHVSERVQNALMSGAGIVHEMRGYARMLTYGSAIDEEAAIYNPPHSTLQVSAADVKKSDFSTTPSHVRFTVDMRTLPDIHDLRVNEVADLIKLTPLDEGSSVSLEVLKDAPGSLTPNDSPIVAAAEDASGHKAQGFNGGDEGRILRLQAGLEGVTIGPGELGFAHMPDERVAIDSIFKAADIYSKLFRNTVELYK